ncbi:hypothetical protein F0L68_34615 [Solihabitans fulvus]|uniref:Methyltransferase domain-containing protein n=1 Tax=Solihabitans fulvus TaxID=1892852 RepID=A0A5B2WNT0_9PSEU|nr:class I SAM-dependent methyltransferase [Solihabitans fulvus]KAA2252658.1 hypothetical protein F0L68_34615 [Solihabitans fulvus]
MTAGSPAHVVAGYLDRVPFARAEAAAVAKPRLLRGLLGRARHVAELPCAAGHFLDGYVDANVKVTLVDGNAAMLSAAVEHATTAGLPAERTHARVALVQELDALPAVDLVVIPNAALNQLACQNTLADLLAGIHAALRHGADLLAQVLCSHSGAEPDASGFYDAARPHDVWFADRYLDPAEAAGSVLRRRCQRREAPNRLRIEFDYVDHRGASLHTTAVHLKMFSAAELTDALTESGFDHVRFLPGHGGLSEILATAARSARS